MPKFYGELQQATFEHLSSDPSGSVSGRFWLNTTEDRIKSDNGSNKRAILRNDTKLVVGNHATAANNVRLNRAANFLLQLLKGDDATAEGTLSTVLAQLSSRLENYTDAGKPAAGNAGRLLWITDLSTVLVDDGAAYRTIGGGGGGGSLQWVEDGQSAFPEIENNIQVYKFAAGITQELYTLVRVPSSYSPGRPITLKLAFYSPANTGNALLRTLATLIRTGTDAVSSTTNQRTSTNSAVTLSAGSVDEPQAVDFDLTSSVGQINSVAVAAGDFIKVKLFRDTDTSTDDLRALVFGADLTFS